MSSAYKCDVCGSYSDGNPTTVHFATSKFSEPIQTFDICNECYSRLQILLGEIGQEAHYLDNKWVDFAYFNER